MKMEKVIVHPLTVGAINAAIAASTGDGRNGAAIDARIQYMQRAVNCGLVQKECLGRAQGTLCNLENQL